MFPLWKSSILTSWRVPVSGTQLRTRSRCSDRHTLDPPLDDRREPALLKSRFGFPINRPILSLRKVAVLAVLFLFALSFLSALSVNPVFASSATVQTDKSAYIVGSTVLVYGS